MKFWTASNFSFTVDNTPPIINSPLDITYSFSETGNYILWSGEDLHPGAYILRKNGSIIAGKSWESSEIIQIDVDGLSPGTYNYTIVIGDIIGNSNSDTVMVTVLATSTEDVTSTTNPELSSGLTSVLVLSGVITLVLTRRKYD